MSKNNKTKNEVLLFFDESGKNNEVLNLIGGLMVPEVIFNSEKIKSYNDLLLSGKYKMHWTSYGGDFKEKERIINVIQDLMVYKDLIDLNIIIYDKIIDPNLEEKRIRNMIYSKFPERIFYGLLRFYHDYTSISASIYIEDDSVYRQIGLTEKITERLNVQSTYRGENYKITSSKYKSKNKIIGLEIVDSLMGIVKSIIENDDSSGKKRAKNELIIELLKDEKTYSFFYDLKIFKWNNTRKLDIIEFNKFLILFLSHRLKWINNLK